MDTRKLFVLLAGMFVLALALAACSSAAGEQGNAGPLSEVGEGEGQVDIIAWAGDLGAATPTRTLTG